MRASVPAGMVLLLAVGLLLAGSKGGCSAGPAGPRFRTAPDFTLLRADGSGSVTLSEVYSRQPVLLVFWATWCPNCVSEVKTLNRWQELYGPRGLKILAVDIQEPRQKLQQFISKHQVAYECLMDAAGETAERYSVDSLPTVVLLAKGGEILYYGFRLPQDVERLLPVQS